jgi:threonine dehydrogenase-like Zn-dependent dehydrogenase
MSITVGVVGAGYVGLTSAVCLAAKGFDTICVDTDTARVAQLRCGCAAIDEPQLGGLLAGSLAHGLGAPLTVSIGGLISICGGIIFGLRWSAHRPLARELIVAQQMTGGAPAQEMTARVFSKTSEESRVG